MICTVEELKEKLDRNDDFILLDVRTHEEWDQAHLPKAIHVPLQELHQRLESLQEFRDKEIICMCHAGGRSALAQQILLSHGFCHVRNLVGGISEWAEKIDPSLNLE